MKKIREYAGYIFKYKKTLAFIILISDALFLIFSNPATIPPGLMALAFLLIYATIYMACYLIAGVIGWMGIVSSVKRWVIIVISFVAFMLVVLQVAGQLSLKDIVILVPLLIIAYLYFTKVTKNITSY